MSKELLVETPEGVVLRTELAGAGARMVASLVDLVGLWCALGVLGGVLFALVPYDASGLTGFLAGALAGGFLLLHAAYPIAFALAMGGQTPGKRLLGLRVQDAEGGYASPLQHVLRGLFWPFEAVVFAFPVPLSVILISATARSQRLGDLVAGTVVIYTPRAGRLSEPFPRESWSALPARTLGLVAAHAERLTPKDGALLGELFTRPELLEPARAELFSAAARHYLGVLGLEEARAAGRAPSELMRELYLFLREHERGPRAPASPPAAGAGEVRESAPGAAAFPR